jgi:hypothetical protein
VEVFKFPVMNDATMADDLSKLWESFSLFEVEGPEMEVQNQVWELGANQGRTCVVGKLIVDHMVSKEIILTTLIRGWKPLGTPTFKAMGDNLFLVDFVDEKGKIRV